MDTKVIKSEYEKFNIPKERIPDYDNDPNKLMGKYKKCSILTYGRTTYSDSTEEHTGIKKEYQGCHWLPFDKFIPIETHRKD
jgi:hypothetical protein